MKDPQERQLSRAATMTDNNLNASDPKRAIGTGDNEEVIPEEPKPQQDKYTKAQFKTDCALLLLYREEFAAQRLLSLSSMVRE
ncbi:hypothetical protein ACJ73_03322 [Blastomyces percursus]|uniref:Uncharacterized protein n=1 Tax=Blastomyces percursus TaxID=1658174 RepID=A0A1J9R9V6_9EURO|nr:hypothetical protein ACJ73_03322 [Blastomyces percursus]